MDKSVIFETEGKLDLRALTVFGLNAKPNASHPIGVFGTGLKYAIAVISRHDIPITIWVGTQKWTIEKVKTDFRGKEFDELQLVRHRKMLGPKAIRLPFTTELGKYWELWQAFRELHANVLDEQGNTHIDNVDGFWGRLDTTKIIVHSEKMVKEFFDRHRTFLPDAMMSRPDDVAVQIFDQPSQYIYYRGIRIFDLKNPSRYTYNILETLTLTEDRTAKYEFEIKSALANFIVTSENAGFIEDVTTAKDSYEKDLPLDSTWRSPSNVFLDTVEGLKGKVHASVTRTVKKYRPPPPLPKIPPQVEFLQELADQLEYHQYQPETIMMWVGRIRKRITDLKAEEPLEEEIPF